MLILRRKQKESIMIGDEIEFTIIAIEGDQVKIGIDAPKHIDIHRKEIYVDIQDQNSAAASTEVTLLKEMGIITEK